jgi:DNA-binding NtrC family response regulator
VASILIIEDDPQIRNVMRRLLERAGHIVREASTGSGGLDLHSAEPADLVITDIFMPGGGGIDVLRRLRRESPGTPTIALSGDFPLSLLEEARALGAWAAIQKPLQPAALMKAVEQVLDQRSRRA